MVFFVILFVVIPLLAWSAEYEFRDRMVAFDEIEDHIQSTDHCGSNLADCLSLFVGSKWPVHVKSREGVASLSGTVKDPDFDVVLDNALLLDRNTEYCQWQESSTETCQTCHREENGKSVDYSCNCATTYHYVKTWRSQRINSLLFDQVVSILSCVQMKYLNTALARSLALACPRQPGAHYNPQRDPYPSTTFASTDARIGGVPLRPAVLLNSHSSVRAATHTVDWTRGARREPAWYDTILRALGFAPGAGRRYEEVATLEGHRRSPAAERERFTYVGQGGYFFSPYTADKYELLFKYFVEVQEHRSLRIRLRIRMHMARARAHIRGRIPAQGRPLASLHRAPLRAVSVGENPPTPSTRARAHTHTHTQFLEGSLLDFQVGDLMPSCTAGDIRVVHTHTCTHTHTHTLSHTARARTGGGVCGQAAVGAACALQSG